MKKNRYSRALKILKSTDVDDKIKSLNEMPTNHTAGLYALNDPGFRVGDKDPEEIFVPDVDGNWPDGVPGTPGEYRYVRPKGFWSGGKNWETVNTPDLSQNYLENDPTGRNTDGLISSDGVVKTFLPPDSRNFILGPVVDGFVPNHTYDAYTNIGYIQKDTRQFVLLARIQGQFKSGLNGNYPVWDGTSNGLTIYNQNFTLEMTQWIRDQVNSDKFISNVPYFYSGGVPQRPQGPTDCPNCPPGMYGGNGYGGGDGSGPFGWGQGGDSQDISVGNQQDPARSGDAKDAGFPWGVIGDAFRGLKGFGDKIGDIFSGPLTNLTTAGQFLSRTLRSLTDPVKYAGDYVFKGLSEGVEYLPDFTGASNLKIFGQQIPKIADWPGAIVRTMTGGNPNQVSNFVDNAVKAVLGKNYSTQYFTPDLPTAMKYAGEGGTVVAIPRTQGIQGMKNWLGSQVSRGFDPSKGVEQLVRTSDAVAADVAGKTIKGSISNADDVARLTQLASQGSKANTVLGKLGRAVPFVGGAAATADVSVRLNQGDYAGALLGGISAIPGPIGWVGLGAQILTDVTGISNPNSPSNRMFQSLFNSVGSGPGGQGAKMSILGGTQGKGIVEGYFLLTEEEFKKNLDDLKEALIELGVPRDVKEFAKQQTIFLMSMGVNPGFVGLIIRAIVGEEFTDKEKKYIKEKLPALIAVMVGGAEAQAKKYVMDYGSSNVNVKESKEVLSESRRRILRDIKKPVVVPEIPKQKYKMNFSGKYSAQNTPDKTSSELSDALVASGNARGQKWRMEDKFWQGYETTERMNVIYDRVGHGDQYWEEIVKENQNKITWKNREIQENLNLIAHEKVMKKENPDYQSPFSELLDEQETIEADKDPLFKKVIKRLKKEIDYSDKPSKNGDPNDPPPEMVNGYHPNYGKRKDYYKKLDPHSASAMPETGDPEIDKEVKAARKKPK